jgi:hypothetical protein
VREVRRFIDHTGPCPYCGGPVDVVQATFEHMPDPKPGRCVYSKWRRDGVFEDAGICVADQSSGRQHR